VYVTLKKVVKQLFMNYLSSRREETTMRVNGQVMNAFKLKISYATGKHSHSLIPAILKII